MVLNTLIAVPVGTVYPPVDLVRFISISQANEPIFRFFSKLCIRLVRMYVSQFHIYINITDSCDLAGGKKSATCVSLLCIVMRSLRYYHLFVIDFIIRVDSVCYSQQIHTNQINSVLSFVFVLRVTRLLSVTSPNRMFWWQLNRNNSSRIFRRQFHVSQTVRVESKHRTLGIRYSTLNKWVTVKNAINGPIYHILYSVVIRFFYDTRSRFFFVKHN